MEIFFFDVYAKIEIFNQEKVIFARIKHYLKEFEFSITNNEIRIKKDLNSTESTLLTCQ